MKTDQQKLIDLLKEFGVSYTISEANSVMMQEGGGAVTSYYGFYVDFNFDPEGKFEDIAIYE